MHCIMLCFRIKLNLQIENYIYILVFYPKRFINEDNRSNQNQQKSNNMQTQWHVSVKFYFFL